MQKVKIHKVSAVASLLMTLEDNTDIKTGKDFLNYFEANLGKIVKG